MHVKINKEIGKEYNETEWEELFNRRVTNQPGHDIYRLCNSFSVNFLGGCHDAGVTC